MVRILGHWKGIMLKSSVYQIIFQYFLISYKLSMLLIWEYWKSLVFKSYIYDTNYLNSICYIFSLHPICPSPCLVLVCNVIFVMRIFSPFVRKLKLRTAWTKTKKRNNSPPECRSSGMEEGTGSWPPSLQNSYNLTGNSSHIIYHRPVMMVIKILMYVNKQFTN